MVERHDVPVSVESILCTEELDNRPSRPPDHEIEIRALRRLTLALSESPTTILQTLAETILQVLQCGSAGISLLTPDGGKRFYWPAIAGKWEPHIGGGTPREFGPCGTVLDRNAPLLFKNVDKVYTYFAPVKPPVEEALLVPFYVAAKAVGTVWAVAHDTSRRFDAEDKRQLTGLATFASAAYQSVNSLSSNQRFTAIVESSDDGIISKNLDGVILSWNSGAQHIFGYTAEEAVGQPITLIIPSELQEEERQILSRLRAGERIDHFETIRIKKNGQRVSISLTISPVRNALGQVIGASKIARDITDRLRVEQALKESEISSRLLQVQDEERRRIARELHDGVGQLVAAISMNIAVVQGEKKRLSKPAAQRVAESAALVDQVSADIRTVSYLLHPPMLDEIGLKAALEWYIDGFGERSKIDAKFEHPAEWERLSQESELCLFRIVQECLTNVHRHSKSDSVLVLLSRDFKTITLEVQDKGNGMDRATQDAMTSGKTAGVGIRGMRERIAAIGGKLTVQSSPSGTTVRVTLPQKEATTTANQ